MGMSDPLARGCQRMPLQGGVPYACYIQKCDVKSVRRHRTTNPFPTLHSIDTSPRLHKPAPAMTCVSPSLLHLTSSLFACSLSFHNTSELDPGTITSGLHSYREQTFLQPVVVRRVHNVLHMHVRHLARTCPMPLSPLGTGHPGAAPELNIIVL